ncbi:MAG: protein phosphatase 2C domain-containing protein [Pseudomonadota bacterium]|nr:protein phosphatase 2C domain-containing protein [Pseudomonadota bacterium]
MDHGYRLSAATGLHKGDREYQQDQVGLFAHPRVTGCVMGVVADGMGGRTGGRKASDQVLLTARQLFERFSPESEDATSILRQIGQEAHLVIKLTAIAAEQEPHSTMAAFLINPGGECHWVHTGDSRLYHFRGNQLVRRTKDQSYVQALVDQGEMTPEEASVHPKSNVLLHCLGTEEEARLDKHYIPQLQIGDTLLACSDGLWHYFTDEELGSVLHSLQPREASEFLIEKARSRAMGGGDNLSIAIVKVEPLADSRPAVGSAFAPLR